MAYKLLEYPLIYVNGCGGVGQYKKLGKIEEGTYGIVYRGMHKDTGKIVALKKIKLDREKGGFPITSLREIRFLLNACKDTFLHENIIGATEVVVGAEFSSVFMVMEYAEQDIRSFLSTDNGKSEPKKVKTLMYQLLKGINYLHKSWIIHRDLKTSNVLLSGGVLKIADFGLARRFDPSSHHNTGCGESSKLTPLVVTLWYRSPELLLGDAEYTFSVDIWSAGCIMGELLLRKPLFPGRGEMDQLLQIFRLLGSPNEKIWPGFRNLKHAKHINFNSGVLQPYNYTKSKFKDILSDKGIDLLNRLLTLDPKKRITAEQALMHEWFREDPMVCGEEL